MSSSSATATASRSPSPATPDSSDCSSSHIPAITIQNHNNHIHSQLDSWFHHSLHPSDKSGVILPNSVTSVRAWDTATAIPHIATVEKDEDQHLAMLPFDDLIEEHAYDDSPYSTFDSSPIFSTSPPSVPHSNSNNNIHSPVLQSPTQSMHASDTLVPSNSPLLSRTKPIPPPPASARPRKRESFAAYQRVVSPPKESCYNLPIMVPSIPEGGTKSRVETQVRVTVDLAHASSSSLEPFKYDRVGSWKWLKLPHGTATKKRTRKEGKIDPQPQDMLHLSVSISCASPPHNPVLCCASCQAREAKRVARKLAARVRPARSDSDSPEDTTFSPNAKHTCKSSTSSKQEDTTSIIQFNCPEVLDFGTGSVVLPLRITCYCRHHREKVGFIVHFSMMDYRGRVVGVGSSRPIMITDDHKTVNANNKMGVSAGVGGMGGGTFGRGMHESDVDWVQQQFGSPTGARMGDLSSVDGRAPSKRKQAKELSQPTKKRSKPYDATGRGNNSSNSAKVSRETSVVSLSSLVTNGITSSNANTSTSPSTPDTRSSTPSLYFGPEGGGCMSQIQFQDSASSRSSISGMGVGDGPCISPSDTMHHQPTFGSTDINVQQQQQQQLDAGLLTADQLSDVVSPNINAQHYPSNGIVVPSPIHQYHQQQQQQLVLPPQPDPTPYMYFDPGSPPPLSSLPLPKIHRLIPSTGPTYGGIEVTILGSHFHPALSLQCVFGGTVASSTQRWSDNTLVCVLPPRASPGVVAVWFDGVGKSGGAGGSGDGSGEDGGITDQGVPPCLFTYTDESDRALMELALQVVGLKMTGKIEDAKNVAMRIVGTSGTGDEHPDEDRGSDTSMMQLASTFASYRDIRPLLITRAGDREDFESVIVDFLSVLDVDVDRSSTTAISAISYAISHTTPSGQTLLHLAALLGFSALVRFLIKHDVDLDARDRNGYTALHFSAVSRSRECARLLVEAGADLEIVNVLGKTPQEQAPFGFFEDVVVDRTGDDADERPVEGREDSCNIDDDDESRWGDGEDEDEDVAVAVTSSRRPLPNRTLSRRRTEMSVNALEDSSADVISYSMDEKKSQKHVDSDSVDEKQTASFVDMIQRTIAQLYAPHGIIPNMPHLPLPHLPGMPAVPWGALPQIPVVFPVFVPMNGWPSLRGEKRESDQDTATEKDEHRAPTGSSAIRAAQEWRATCEKWMALAMATATMRQEDAPPPMYTPRTPVMDASSTSAPQSEPDDEGESSSTTARPHVPTERPRRFGYSSVHITDQDVNAFGYRPAKLQAQKKDDRMLVYFWIPILLMSMLWALYTGTRYAFHVLRNSLPVHTALRG